jgi:hypothetical protein
MSDDGLIVVWFLLSLFGCLLIMWTSLVAAKYRVTGCNGNLSARFFISLGGFGQRQIENWKHWGGYDEDQAKTIIKQQVLCWLGMVLWGLASMAVVLGYKALTYEG